MLEDGRCGDIRKVDVVVSASELISFRGVVAVGYCQKQAVGIASFRESLLTQSRHVESTDEVSGLGEQPADFIDQMRLLRSA